MLNYILRNDGKPPGILAKIVIGKLHQYLFQTHNSPNLDRSRGNCHYIVAMPILYTLAMMAESASNLTLPSWLSHTQGPPPFNNSHSPHMYLDSLSQKKKLIKA